MPGHDRLLALCEDAARGRFPPPEWGVEVLPAPDRVAGAVVALTAHHVVAADVDPDEVRAHLDPADIAAPASPTFLAWLGERLDASVGHIDVTLARLGGAVEGAVGVGGPPVVLHETSTPADNERVDRARRLRAGVRFYEPAGGGAVVTLGTGLAGRLELSMEIDGEHRRGQGLGRALVAAAVAVVPADVAVFASVAPGNARSVRSLLAIGFQPIGAECVLTRRR